MSEKHNQPVPGEEKDSRRKSTPVTSPTSGKGISYCLPGEDAASGALQHTFVEKTSEQQEIVIEVDEADIKAYDHLEETYGTFIDSSSERQEIVIELDGADEIDDASYGPPSLNPPPQAYFYESSETFSWKIGDVIDEKYEVQEVIGQGGMGVVYKVRHREWNVDLAVKMPLSDLMSHDLIKTRFIREAQTWVDLGLHPNIVQCWYVRELEGAPCVFMDYLEGGSLKDWMRQGYVKQGGWEKILDIIIQACDGLGYAHQHGVDAHRDVKPGNFLMTSEGELRVTDFGIVKYQGMPEPEEETWREPILKRWAAEGTLTVTGADLGTPEYSAPEQWGKAKHADARSDIYALGGILFELCCGRRAFDDRLHRAPAPVLIGRHLFSPVPDPKMFDQNIPDSLAELIIQCLAKEPDERPDSMMELRERLVWIYHEVTGKVYWRDVPQAAELRSSALNNRAISLLDLNKKQEALSTFQEALQLDAHHPESVYNLSLLEWRDKRISDMEVVQRLKEAKQASWRAGLYLGFVHLERASADEAERELSDALQQHPNSESGQAWRALGDALMALEKFVDAENAYQKALALMPGDKITRRNLMLAKQRTRYQQNRLLFPWPRCLQTFVGYSEEVTLAALTPNGRFALIGNDEDIQLWDLARGRFFGTFTWVGYQNSWILQGFAQGHTEVCITPDGTRVVSGGNYEPNIQLRALSTGQCLRIFEGHTQGIHALTITPDGRFLISGSLDTTLRLWDLTTGGCLRIFRGHNKPVTAVSVSSDGKVLVSGGGKIIRVWDLLTGQYVRRFRGHKDTITALAVTRSNRIVVSGSQDATLGVWQLSSGRRLQTFTGHTASVTAIALSPDDSLVISASGDRTLRIWDMERKKCLRVLTGHTNTITSVTVSPDGRLIFSVSWDRTLRVWELDTGKCLQTFEEFTYALEAVEVTPDGQQILVGNHEELRLKNLTTGIYQQAFTLYKEDKEHIIQQLERLERKNGVTKMGHLPPGEAFLTIQGKRANTSSLQITADGRFAITGGQHATLSLWDVAKNKRCLWIFRGTDGLQIFQRNKNWMNAVAISQNEQLLLSGWFDASVRVWDPSTAKCLRVLKGHMETVAAVAMTLDGRFGVSGSFDTTIRLWDLATGDCLYVFEGHNGTVSTVAISPDGRYILSGSTDKTLRLWESKSGKCLQIFEGHRDGIMTVAISENGQYALSRSADRTFRLWVLDTGEQPYRATLQVCRQNEHQEAQMFKKRFLKYLNRAEVAISSGKMATAYTFLALARSVPGYERDPKALALNSTLGSVLQRKTLRAGRLLRTFEEHQDVVNAIAETPDGKFAISGSRDRTLKLWTLSTETCLRTLEGHTSNVSCVAVTPDRHFAISGSWDRTLRLWALATGECLKIFDEHEDYVRTVAITPEGRFVLSGGRDNTLRLWSLDTAQTLEAFQGLVVPLEAAYKAVELTTAKSLRVLKGHTSDVGAIAISADGQFAVSGGWDKTMRLWSLSTGKCLRVFRGHKHYITSVVITANGRFAISGSRDMTLRLWSLSRGKCLRVFEGHTDYVNAVALTSDGRFILSGSRDHTLRLWHLATGECLQVFDRHEGSVEAVAMTPDGRFVLSGGRDNTLRLWEFDWKLAPTKKAS